MKNSFLSKLALYVMLVGATTAPTWAQQYYSSSVIVPPSSVVHSGDAGQRAHTDVRLMRPELIKQPSARPMGGQGPSGGMTPTQIYAAYDVKPQAKARGANIIAIIDAYDNPNALQDFNTFSAQFGLAQETSTNVLANSNKHFQVIYQGGTQPPSAITNGWNTEEALDTEWAHAMAPNAKVILFEAQSSGFGDLFATISMANAMAGKGGVKEVSMSWGAGEVPGINYYDSFFTTGQGIEYFASTGDGGSWPQYGILPSYPATSPFVIACGGTTIATTEAGDYLYQIPWGEGVGSGGTGGPSAVEPRPSYQNGVANTDPNFRSTPDLCADADINSGVSFYDVAFGGWGIAGGTSVSTPLLAGLSNAAGHFHSDSVAELTLLYANPKEGIKDLQFGFTGYFALPGYDFASGLGVPQGLGGL